MADGRLSVLFICTANSARSQMAEGLTRHLFGDRCDALSAGTFATRLHPLAVRAMREIGVDISRQRSKSIEEFRGARFDVVVTVCDSAKETCPFFPAAGELVHRGFADPAAAEGTDAERLEVFRRSRDEIREWIVERFGEGART